MWVPVFLAAACLATLVAAAPSPAPQLPPELPMEHETAAQDPKSKGMLESRIRRLSVGQHYTIQQKHRKSVAKPHAGRLTAASTDPMHAASQDPDGTADPTLEGPDVGERIIRVPKRRNPTGCRYYQRTDVLGQCRNRW
ncbi:uncharacterized protein LOC113204087 [Frankliniella occidentalis]|uniref:Uncharacterized protein LOC113204087 n=1 Tax=Frankliniella occidentalis TaxID=133901 RepID=A0A6J1S6M5_FRAOC|nr:uncharacterized protein LOC113204087 [Frankliniella occidentalis]